MLQKVFTPIMVGNLEIKNRFVVPPMVTNMCDPDGVFGEQYLSYYEAKAKGGWGLIITENLAVDKSARAFRNNGGLWNDEQLEANIRLTQVVHRYGAKICAQIYHAGRETSVAVIGQQPVAPSPIKDPVMPDAPRELEANEILEIVEKFGDAALRAKKAGFDAVEIHCAHGYLLNTFMSPFSNKRTDKYGGTFLNRARFALEVIENVKSKVGNDFPVLCRISAEELIDGGLTIEDTKVFALLFQNAGIHALDVSFGVFKSGAHIAAASYSPHAKMVKYAEEMKKVLTIPVITVGRINDPLIAESVILSGKADLVAMGRASLADPEMPNKARRGKYEDILRCIGCRQVCNGNLFKDIPIGCLLNPVTGNENSLKIVQSPGRKKIFVAGGGIAGMEAAITAATKGHEVHLFEKCDRLGGQWLLAAVPPNREELSSLTVWQKAQLEKLKVSIHINTELTKQTVLDGKPDAVIIATGAVQYKPDIPGVDSVNVIQAWDILAGRADTGTNAVVIGHGLANAETASHLANHGKRVTLLDAKDSIAPELDDGVRLFLIEELKTNNVEIITGASVKEICKDGVLYEKDGKCSRVGNMDSIVTAYGSKPVSSLEDMLKGLVEKLVVVGDAHKSGNAAAAVREGYLAGLEI